MKRVLRATAYAILRVVSGLLSPVFVLVARTGAGSGSALRRGFVPTATHFYQPVFDPADVPASVWERRHDMPGVRFDLAPQLAYLDELAEYASEASWPDDCEPGQPHYYSLNSSFGYSSGCLLHCVVRHAKPSRVIEVGAGMSTLLFADALQRNADDGHECKFITVDPFPPGYLTEVSLPSHWIRAEKLEEIDPSFIADLAGGDMLFIDSSHVVRTGGDVNHLYLDVLPRLATDVIVHVHDIQFPYEYPRLYSARETPPRVFWTEQYLLQAFLAFNDAFTILAAGYYLQLDHAEEFRRRFPGWNPAIHRPTTSFYMKRS